MGSPIQNPGYFGAPANDAENNQLNDLENQGAYGNPTPSPDPLPSPDAPQSGDILPSDANIFQSVSDTYQNNATNLDTQSDSPSDTSSGPDNDSDPQ